MPKKLLLACLLNCACLMSVASAHYLWVAVSGGTSGKATANVYFEEGPGPGTGEYLDPIIKSGKTWIRTVDKPEPEMLKTQDTTESKKRWLTAELAQPAPRSIDSYGKFGVYRYGQTDVLLRYYARYLDVSTHEDLHELARAKNLRLDIVAHDEADHFELTVLWEGKPATGRTVYVRGPKGVNQNLTTDDKGEARLEVKEVGRYTFRTFVEEDKPGREDDKTYSLIRHHASLVMNLPLKK